MEGDVEVERAVEKAPQFFRDVILKARVTMLLVQVGNEALHTLE